MRFFFTTILVSLTISLFLRGNSTAFARHYECVDSMVYITKPIIKKAEYPFETLNNGSINSKKSYSTKTLLQLPTHKLSIVPMIIPGMEHRDYGGPGSLSLFSTRGLGPQRTIVLFDGIPLSSPQNGMYDMNAIPISRNQEISVDLGGSSSIVGSGAISGVIELSTPYFIDSTDLHAEIGLGSFGETSLKTHINQGDSLKSFMLNIDYSRYAGDYPFLFQPPGNSSVVTIQRTNGQNSLINLFGRAAYKSLDAKSNYSFWTAMKSSERGVPGAVLSGKIEQSSAIYTDKEILTAFSVSHQLGVKNTIKGGVSYRYGIMHFLDTNALYAGKSGVDNQFTTNDFYASISALFIVNAQTLLTLKGILGHTVLSGEMLQPEASNEPKRTFGALSCRLEYDSNPFSYDIGCRADIFSDVTGKSLSGYLATRWEILPAIKLTSKISKDFRAPSFNELYYLNYGTVNLKPEHSVSLECGIVYNNESTTVDCNFYSINLQDQIVSIPISPVQWSARNIGAAESQGIECSILHSIPIYNLFGKISYAYKDVRDKADDSPTFNKFLPYVPSNTAMVLLGWKYRDITVHAIGHYTGKRFALPDNSEISRLNPVFLVSSSIEYNSMVFGEHCFLKGEARNILDTKYSFILNFPLPGRSFMITCGIALH